MTTPKLLRYASWPHTHEVHGSGSRGGFQRQLGVALVSVLCLCSRPAAVVWFVTSAVVDAVKASTIRAFTQVCVEVFKTEPSLAYRYASATVSGKSFVGWRCAALNHAIPRAVRRCFVHAVFCLPHTRRLCKQAPARSHKTSFKAVDRSGFFVATFAKTSPHRNPPLLFARGGDCGKPAKPLTGYVLYHVRSIHKRCTISCGVCSGRRPTTGCLRRMQG